MSRWVSLLIAFLVCAPVAPAEEITWEHFVGSKGGPGEDDGRGAQARFYDISGLAFGPDGMLYVAEGSGGTIRRVDPDGNVATVAGLRLAEEYADGQGGRARFAWLHGLVRLSNGDLVTYDTPAILLRRVSAMGQSSPFAGRLREWGYVDGPASEARFTWVERLASDSVGNIYMTESYSHTIRKASPEGVVSTIAGKRGEPGFQDGTGAEARFSYPTAIACTPDGILFVADENRAIRRILPAGEVTTVARDLQGGGAALAVDSAGNVYFEDFWQAGASPTKYGIVKLTPGGDRVPVVEGVRFVRAMTFSNTGQLVFALGSEILQVEPDGSLRSLAGSEADDRRIDGGPDLARFHSGWGVAVQADGSLAVADRIAVRRVALDRTVTTIAGSLLESGTNDGPAPNARFMDLKGIMSHPTAGLLVTDPLGLRRIDHSGMVTTVAGSTSQGGAVDGVGASARFNDLWGVGPGPGADFLVADLSNCAIRRITPAFEVSTFAGSLGDCALSGYDPASIKMGRPTAVAAWQGDRWVASQYTSYQLLLFDSFGKRAPLAGHPHRDGESDGRGTGARVRQVIGLAPRGEDLLFTDGARVRRLAADGAIESIGGFPDSGGIRDGTGSAARFLAGLGIAVAPDGTIFKSDDTRIVRGQPALPDVASVDEPISCVGHVFRFDVQPRTATSWSWRPIRAPARSNARLSATDIPNPSFTPDVADIYVFEVTASTGNRKSIRLIGIEARALENGECRPVPRCASPFLFIPAVAHADGLDGSKWRTNLHVKNPTPVPAVVEGRFFARNRDNRGAECQELGIVPPYSTRIFEDVLPNQLGESGAGALAIGSVEPAIQAWAQIRDASRPNPYVQELEAKFDWFLSRVGGGGFDLGFNWVEWKLEESDRRRTNVGLVDFGGAGATLELSFYEGQSLLGSRQLTLQPNEVRQLHRAFRLVTAGVVLDGRIKIRILAGASLSAYASVVDTVTGEAETTW